MANVNKHLNVIAQVCLKKRLLMAILLINYLKRRKIKKRKCWISMFLKKHNENGAFYVTIPEMLRDSDLFTNYCRMSRVQFEELLTLVAPKIKKSNAIRKSIEPVQRLLLTLRYLASGDSMMSLKYQYYIAQPTISQIIVETCNALWTYLMPRVLNELSCDDWLNVAQEFDIKCHFPHCLGAVDGKHVIVQAPPNSGSAFYNYKNAHSIVSMAICDSNYRFLFVDIGAEGRQSDGGIWSRSSIGCAFARGDMNIPPSDYVCEEHVLPYVFVADEAFQLTNYMMRPYPGKNLTKEKRIFNYRLSTARRMVECTFGILTSQWRIYRRPINASLDTAGHIVKATIVLHNFLRQKSFNNDSWFNTSNIEDEIACIEQRAGALQNINNIGSNTNTREASQIRNNFTTYFNNIGAIPWQNSMIAHC